MRSIGAHMVSVFIFPLFISANTVPQQGKPENIDQGWYSRVSKSIEQSEYCIKSNGPAGAFQSPNRAQNLRITYFYDGFSMQPRVDSTGTWKVDLRVRSIQKGKDGFAPLATGRARRTLDADKLIVHHETFDCEYVNAEDGMRQNFIVYKQPAGSGMLTVNLEVKGSLVPIKKGMGDVLLAEKNEKFGNYQSKVWYKGLKSWDADGKELSSSVVVDENKIALVVNDLTARYPVTIDPLSTTADWTVECGQATAEYGYDVSCAGDVNGDGYSDVIVGARYYDNGQHDEGMAFVYHGGPSGLSTTADWTAEGGQSSAWLGYCVSGAGDVNGDGYADVVIGAPLTNVSLSDEGMVYVFHGGAAGLSLAADWMVGGDTVSTYLGMDVSGAGDVNGDGYSDVIIGSKYADEKRGRAYIYYGSSGGLSPSADWTGHGNDTTFVNTLFGANVACAGDVNGDGYSDVIVGESQYSTFSGPPVTPGKAHVFYGSAAGLADTADWWVISTAEGGFAMMCAAGAGDVNGDGYADVIIGAPGYGDSARCLLYYGGSAGLSSTVDHIIGGESDFFGVSVSCAGDVNGDGYAEVVVGAKEYENGNTDEGKAYLYYGGPSGLSDTAAWSMEGDRDYAYYGASVSGAGDVNGDGYSDIIVGESGIVTRSVTGKVDLYYGHPAGLSENAGWTGEADQADTRFGISVSSAGDVNADGYYDIVVGARDFDNGQVNEGRAYVFLGGPAGPADTAVWTAEGDQDSAGFGASVSGAGDVNGDGYSDIIVGTDKYDNGGTDEGKACVFFGSAAGPSALADWTVEGGQDRSGFAACVSGAGDVNGDGYADVVIGAASYDSGAADEGAAFLYFGHAAGPSTVPDWTTEGGQVGAGFASCVSSAGDVNGDGYSDIIVGADAYDNGQTDEGGAFVYYGGTSGPSDTTDWTAEGDQAGAAFGSSVSSAGDVNGDGYSDVIIGAEQYDDGSPDEGAAFVYYGGSAGLSTGADWFAEGNQDYAVFGSSVSGAGDVNGDGYADVIVGAEAYDCSQGNEGAAFVYYGGQSGLAAAAGSVAEGDQVSAGYAHSVSGAGDVDGDGYSDIIIGAFGYDNGETNEGRVYIYYGNDGGGFRSYTKQYQANLVTPMAAGGLCTAEGGAGLALYAKSYMGRQKGKMVYEYRENGEPYSSDSLVTNSVAYTGISGNYADLGAAGTELKTDISGLTIDCKYKWRARIMYDPVTSFTGQVYGPWRYMPNAHIHEGGLRSSNMSLMPPVPVYPPDNGVDILPDTALIWNLPPGPYTFGLQVSTSVDFASTVADTADMTDTTYSLAALDDDTVYYWRVNVSDGNGTGGWSDVRCFTIYKNDAPLADPVADPAAVTEGAGMQSVHVTGIADGDPQMQAMILTAVSSDTSLIPDPAVLYTSDNTAGYLQYTPSANANGTATISVKVRDDGGTRNNGVDTTIITFDVEVTPVNDAPSFTPGSDQVIGTDAGSQSVAAWATGISAGPANESGQTFTFNVTTDNDALFETLPAIDSTGELTYTAADDSSGSAVVSVQLKDDGGTANGGIDSTETIQFTITVEPVNIAPVITSAVVDTAHRTVPYYYAVTADDPGDTLAYTLVDHPAWLHIGGPVVYGTPPDSVLADTSFTVIATDGELSDTVTVQLAVLPGDGKVPVDLTSFTAVELNGTVLLEWTTQSELDNLGWDVRRGTSPVGPFQVITGSIVSGAGSTQEPQSYVFTDTTAGTGLWYYQLVQYDVGGDRQFSYVVAAYVGASGIAEIGSGGPFNIRVTNPAGAVDVTFDARYAGTVRVLVTDVRGRVVGSAVPRQGAYHASGLEPGIYYVMLDDGSSRETVKVLITD